MKTEEELNNDIFALSMEIATLFPELLRYIGEIPARTSKSSGSETTVKNLIEYYASLEALLQYYMPNEQTTLEITS